MMIRYENDGIDYDEHDDDSHNDDDNHNDDQI